MDYIDRDFLVGQLTERVGKCFRRSALVRLDHDAQRPLLTRGCLRHEVLERHHALGGAAALCLTIETLTALSDLAGLDCIFDYDELVARDWHPANSDRKSTRLNSSHM